MSEPYRSFDLCERMREVPTHGAPAEARVQVWRSGWRWWFLSGGIVEWDGVRHRVWATPWFSFWVRIAQKEIRQEPESEMTDDDRQSIEAMLPLTAERRRYLPAEVAALLDRYEKEKRPLTGKNKAIEDSEHVVAQAFEPLVPLVPLEPLEPLEPLKPLTHAFELFESSKEKGAYK